MSDSSNPTPDNLSTTSLPSAQPSPQKREELRSIHPGVMHWHLIFGGFRQTAGDGSHNGSLRLWYKLFSLVASTTCCVEWHPWNTDVRNHAERIHEFIGPDVVLTRPANQFIYRRINVYAYSWGATAALRFAEALKSRGLKIDVLVLSDGVYRHWYRLGQWRAMTPRTLVVPDNVRRVVWYYQTRPRFSLRRWWSGEGHFAEPAGHKVVPADPARTRVAGIRLYYDHSHMDNAHEWHASVLKAACNGEPLAPRPLPE